MAAPARYAIYFAPSPETALARFGAHWLGRDVETGRKIPQTFAGDLSAARFHKITRLPRHYGFHSTLKPPFYLREGESVEALETALAEFSAERRSFALPPLEARAIDRFVALVPAAESAALSELAGDCVTEFDRFRAPAEHAELESRRKAGLNAHQEEMLLRWGYPYVLDTFRFHMTLTERLDDAERRTVLDMLAPLLAPVLNRPVAVDGIALCSQPDRKTPFTLRRRFWFGG